VTRSGDDARVRDDAVVVELVERARGGDATAWDAIVARYAGLIWGVCRRYDLSPADADDVAGAVWLLLVRYLETIRDPAALPGWLASTTRRECFQLLRRRKRQSELDQQLFDDAHDTSPDLAAGLLVEERRHALRLAFADLRERCRQLLTLLFADPPPSYAEVSAALDMRIGAIGPTRKRCLEQLRNSPALAEYGYAAAASADRDEEE
jgi:RNA polymerase sigma factor (sigma-70 family)